MATYSVAHPDLPEDLKEETTVSTLSGHEIARSLPAAHVAGILWRRGDGSEVHAADLLPGITITEVA
ncbi:Uncharacterised protein [Mycobacteroides abscessus subsp. abscessus]|uniref:hypothetical protein n=1 Tax=Mycobacteroides abscessus TaxID=36809 RepID=UPI000928B40C|nr:hypothetical protein [Mycobacteroides abscessus]SIM06334.1 Uncharacterised protein [Mycobacteroides abscessus subsp. abscessus]SLC77179.1 Uncharacterised protein [Mycobacteroides abscessus subsp. abscessus]